MADPSGGLPGQPLQEVERVRSNFPETWLWNNATVRYTWSPSLRFCKVLLFNHSRNILSYLLACFFFSRGGGGGGGGVPFSVLMENLYYIPFVYAVFVSAFPFHLCILYALLFFFSFFFRFLFFFVLFLFLFWFYPLLPFVSLYGMLLDYFKPNVKHIFLNIRSPTKTKTQMSVIWRIQ